ncbi:PQQ-dependent catabolism-associated CXXCW motif protein [Sphingobium sp. OAS761]|uniref:rhodanese-like domain-containing protein n=1 Tax=Sphingobium sp. OAS761 TaxID=2817901 RepID=UPI0020A16A92|nr:rhodanese-like domain-containing protein [Sphingobium sp. OAS761]MCP1469727.1 PQQ-dependent catabolism-associated CXXCW motif protein [Sphingobium sp. OAS761]
MRTWMLALLLPASQAQAEEPLFNAQGYRAAHYRGPTLRPPGGVTRIAPAAAAQLQPDRDALFIDVMPAEGGRRDSDGRWRLTAVRESIPGAHWFPESGRGEPDPEIVAGFSRGLARLTRGRRGKPLIVFCRADCWMSWNAAKRLRAMGYDTVWWLAEGTDGWRDLGLPLSVAIPEGGIAR